jgi:acylphosphatase
MAMNADAARDRYKKIRARFTDPPPLLKFPGALSVKQNGREVEILANGNSEALLAELKSKYRPEELRCEALSLEEIFVSAKTLTGKSA